MKERFIKAVALMSPVKSFWIYLVMCLGVWCANMILLRLPQVSGTETYVGLAGALVAVMLLCVERWVASWILEAQGSFKLARFMRISTTLCILLLIGLYFWIRYNWSVVLGMTPMPEFFVYEVIIMLYLFSVFVYLWFPYTEFIGFFGWQKFLVRQTALTVTLKILCICAMVFLSLIVALGVGCVAVPDIIVQALQEGGAMEYTVTEIVGLGCVLLYLVVPLQLIAAAWVRPTWKSSLAVALTNIVGGVVWARYPTAPWWAVLGLYIAVLVGILLPAPRQAGTAVAVIPERPLALKPTQPIMTVEEQPKAVVAVAIEPTKRGRPSKKAKATAEAKVQSAKRRGRPPKAAKKPGKRGRPPKAKKA